MLLGPSSSSAASGNWTQFGHDAQRTSVDPDQPPVTGVAFHWSHSVDGAVFAQPLVFNGRVYVATENNSIYAFDADTGAQIWHQSSATLGAPATDADLVSGTIHCSNLGPTVGITGTPVIDPATNRLYAVAQVRSPSLHYVLWTLDLSSPTGAPIGAGRTIDPWALAGDNSFARAIGQQQRAGLLLANNYVYVGFGGRVQGCGQFQGWLAAVPVGGQAGGEKVFEVPAQPKGGSIWSPGGPSADSAGNVWVSTSDAAACTPNCQSVTRDLTDSVVKFSPTLGLVDSFTPSNWVDLSNKDLDLGVYTPTHLGNGLAFQIGKDGVGYLLRESNLGHSFPGTGAPPPAELATGQVCKPSGTGPKGTAAWVSPNLYVACPFETIKRVHFTFGTSPSFSIAATGPAQSYAASTIMAGGVVWNIDPKLGQVKGTVASATLNSYDPQTMQARFAPIQIKTASGTTVSTTHFASPASGNGHIYVGAVGQIVAYRLTSSATTTLGTPGAPTASMAANSSIMGAAPVDVRWTASSVPAGKTARYVLERSADHGATWTVLATTATNSALAQRFNPGTYLLRVHAEDAATTPTLRPSATATSGSFTIAIAQETSAAITYSGTWTASTLTGASGGSVKASATAGNSATFNFSGTGFDLAAGVGPNRGQASVTVDGGTPVTIDLYSATAVGGVVKFARSGLAAGPHVVTVKVLGTRNASSTGTSVAIDAFATHT